MSASVLRNLDALERALGAAGFPAMSPWWRATVERFYASGRRQLVLRVGRRGGKSSTLCRLAVLEGLFGEHVVAPGDVGVVAIVSVSRDEASQRLRLIKAILTALHVKWRPVDGGIELEDRAVVFKVFAASVAGVSGFSCICAIADEVAKWRDADTGANPATEVLASLRPTLAGQPHAKIFLSSSPMGRQDAHARAFDQGDTAFQIVAVAETWVARPSLTEAETHALEPDEDTWRREYGAVPFDGSELSLFSESMILAVTRKSPSLVVLPREPGLVYTAAQDPATRANAWTLAIATERPLAEDRSRVSVALCREWRARRGGALDSDATLAEIALILGDYGTSDLWQDQWSFDTLNALASRHGIDLALEASSAASKVQLFEALKRRMVDGTIDLPDDPVVRSDLMGVRKWISKAGAFTIELERQPNGRHSDHAASIALALSKVASGTGPSWGAACQAFVNGGPDKPKAALTLVTHYANGLHELRGGGNFENMRVLFSHAGDPGRFSAKYTLEFEHAVIEYRKANSL